ncbi:NIPSNAP family protein [Terriglobus roseus]|uniref:NIPSNAP protein n=1 Tax=Terriglobus roseus TaxID=392734 RepID=A0A1H4LTB3_9BACT|nr:NIPSNAP family protein [Terriglobus roseus]SEB73906.1 NIPSNAP protein [Terriglobus roseus]
MKLKQFLPAFLMCASWALAIPARPLAAQVSTSKVYELRIYTANAGKLAELEALLGAQGIRIFGKHGIQNVFDGTVLEGAPIDGADATNMLICILGHKSSAAANKDWAEVDADPAWKTAWAGAEKSGPLLSRPASSLLLEATSFTPVLEAPTAAGAPTRVFELRKYNTGAERLPAMVDEFQSGLAAILVKVGMTPILYTTAEDKSSFVYLLAHKDREAARASWTAFTPEFRPFMAQFNAKQAATAPPADPAAPPRRRTPDDNRFLVPTSFSPIR